MTPATSLSWPAEECSLRLRSVYAEMTRAGVKNLIVYSPAALPINTAYVANFEPLAADGAFVVLNEDREPRLLVHAVDGFRARRDSWISDVTGYDDELAVFSGRELAEQQTAIAGVAFMKGKIYRRLSAALGYAPTVQDAIITRAGQRKTPAELHRIRFAAGLADRAYERARAVIRPGISEFEVSAELDLEMRRLGATDNFGLLSFAPSNVSIAKPRRRPAEDGDTCIFEITPAVGGRSYSAQLCRTSYIGTPPEAIERAFALLQEALAEGLTPGPGSVSGEIVRRLNAVFEKAGYGEYCRPPYMRARGHGFGVGRLNLTEESSEILEPGMAFIVHPNQWIPDVGYLALGDMVIVGESELEVLTHCTTQLSIAG